MEYDLYGVRMELDDFKTELGESNTKIAAVETLGGTVKSLIQEVEKLRNAKKWFGDLLQRKDALKLGNPFIVSFQGM